MLTLFLTLFQLRDFLKAKDGEILKNIRLAFEPLVSNQWINFMRRKMFKLLTFKGPFNNKVAKTSQPVPSGKL